ncbi:cytochrome c oxidase subunit II [Synechococcus sp. UW140]|uniref:cytochrome c oxidase subunit II n=1 Tax=Synechococcus sp. UW140 TaxID=368503 RepID=UPI000E0E87F8|nr:cytochrome c oxidase subunit II [Synechococcus sp. UW140]
MTSTSPSPRQGLPIRRILVISLATLVNLVLSIWMAQWSVDWLPVAASTAAPYVDGLFSLEVGIGCFIFVGCVGFILWSVLFSRADKYDESDGLPIEGNTRLEIAWTVIPFVVVMALAFYSIHVNEQLASLGPKTKYDLAVDQQPDAVAAADNLKDIGPIRVISRQWSWEFVYPDGVRSSELHLPVSQRANFQLSSEDVLHSFYVPAFRLKQDIIPGSVISYSITPTREGTYRLRDAMFSGAYFSSNQTHVIVESGEAYDQWLKKAASQPLVSGLSQATELYQQRLAKGDRGWATVPPAAPPMVNDPGHPDVLHDA